MSQPTTRQIIAKQVTRARRRLVTQLLLRHLAVAWAIGSPITAVWMLAGDSSRVGCGGPCSAAPWAGHPCSPSCKRFAGHRRTPMRPWPWTIVSGLREPMVTITEPYADLVRTPAGMALSEPTPKLASRRSRSARSSRSGCRGRAPWCRPERWPSHLWSSSTIRRFPLPRAKPRKPRWPPEKKKDIEKKLEELAKKPRTPEKPGDRPKSEDLKRLEARLDEIAKKPRDTTKQLRDRIKDLTPLEEEIKKLERDHTEKARMLQQQLQAKDQMMPNDVPKDGPAKDFSKALGRGRPREAKNELDKLAKKIEDNELTEKEKSTSASNSTTWRRRWTVCPSRRTSRSSSRSSPRRASSTRRPSTRTRQDQEGQRQTQGPAKARAKARPVPEVHEAGRHRARPPRHWARLASNSATSTWTRRNWTTSRISSTGSRTRRTRCARRATARRRSAKATRQTEATEVTAVADGNGQPRAGGRTASRARSGPSTPASSAIQPEGPEDLRRLRPRPGVQDEAGSRRLAGEIQQAAQKAPDAIEVQRIPKAARDMAKGYFKNLGGQKDEAAKDQPRDQPEK